ncbi:24933_t:CDS:2, partial [Gigaspora rosea]
MFEIQNSYQVFDECDMNNDTTYYHEDDMNNETTYYPEDDMEIALPPMSSEYEHGRDTLSAVENVVDSDSSELESEDVEDGISECSNLEDEPNDSSLKDIYTGQTFTSFEVLEKYLKHYSMKKGFETKIIRAEKENDIFSRKTYKCRHGGKYLPKKKLDPTTNKKWESACIECGFVLNASYRKRLNLVFVNKFFDEHNHALNDCKLLQLSPSLRKIPTHIRDEIRFYVQECHLGATVLKRILRNKFSDQEIYDRDLYNMISRFKADVQIKNDALTLYESLVKLQQENPDWYFKVDFKGTIISFPKYFGYHQIKKYPEVQGYCYRVLYSTKECWTYAFMRRKFSANTHSTQRVESINRVIKLEANSGNSLCQLRAGIELRLKDEAKYARLQEFRNMNPTTGLPNISNTIFKGIDDMYDYEEPQILLKMALEDCYGFNVTEIWEAKHIQSTTNHSQFVLLLDDAHTISKKALFNMKLIPSRWYSEEGLEIFDKNQEPSVQLVQNENEQFSTSSFQVLQRIRGQEKALNMAPTNGSNQVLENILQRFIDEQGLLQSNNQSGQELNQENDSFNISNPSQHKGKGHLANKRYLIAIEDYNNKNISS